MQLYIYIFKRILFKFACPLFFKGAKFPKSRKGNAMTVYMLPIWIFVDTFVLLFSGLMFESVNKLGQCQMNTLADSSY